MSKVKVTKYIDGQEVTIEVDYKPNKGKHIKGDMIKKPKKKKKRKSKNKYIAGRKKHPFYDSTEWYKLRYRVLQKYDASCMCCGQSPKRNKIVLHVDHIKPRSKYPSLELCFDNLQILCAACNLGKSNLDDTDWRPLLSHEIELITKFTDIN